MLIIVGQVLDMNEVEMLQQRVKHLEEMLNQTTNLLDDMVRSANVFDICDYLTDAEELIGESRAVLEGEVEE